MGLNPQGGMFTRVEASLGNESRLACGVETSRSRGQADSAEPTVFRSARSKFLDLVDIV